MADGYAMLRIASAMTSLGVSGARPHPKNEERKARATRPTAVIPAEPSCERRQLYSSGPTERLICLGHGVECNEQFAGDCDDGDFSAG